MPTAAGKPQKGDTFLYDLRILGVTRGSFRGTVLEWPRYGTVRVRIDEVLHAEGDLVVAGSVCRWDEHTAAMYLANGTVREVQA